MRKSILITGAGSGIGRETALYFAEQGWFIGLFDLNQEGVKDLWHTIETEYGPGRACFSGLDVTEPKSIQACVVLFLEKAQGQMDLLFNSAGLLAMGHHHTIDLDRQKAIVDVNLTGVLNMIQACFPALKTTPNAAVITMSSASAVYGTPELAVYSATKHGIRGLTEALNIEFGPHDIHVGDIMVSFVQTPMVLDAPASATSLKKLGAVIHPGMVARTVYKAYESRKVHYHVGGLLKMLIMITTLLPFAKRFIVRRLGFSHNENP